MATPTITAPEFSNIDPAFGDQMLNHLRFTAEVDFLHLQVTLGRASNGGAVRRVPGITFAKPIDPGPGAATRSFNIRIDDPGSWARVQSIVDALNASHEVVGPVLLKRIEVSLDAYAAPGHRDLLPHMVTRFYRFLTRHVSDNSRTAAWQGSAESAAYALPNNVLRKVKQGRMIYIGNKRDERYQRLYLKTTDRAGKVALPLHEHRARLELCLSGSALPADTLEAAKSFDFRELRDWFLFRRLRDDHAARPIVVQVCAARQGVLGTRQKRPGRVLYDPLTCADRRLNDRAYDALRGLTKKMVRVQKCRSNPEPVHLDDGAAVLITTNTSDAAGEQAAPNRTEDSRSTGAVPGVAQRTGADDRLAGTGHAHDHSWAAWVMQCPNVLSDHHTDSVELIYARERSRHLDEVRTIEAPELHEHPVPPGPTNLDAVHQGDVGAGREERSIDLQLAELIQQVIDGLDRVDRFDQHGEVAVRRVEADGAVREVPDEDHVESRSE